MEFEIRIAGCQYYKIMKVTTGNYLVYGLDPEKWRLNYKDDDGNEALKVPDFMESLRTVFSDAAEAFDDTAGQLKGHNVSLLGLIENLKRN